MNKTFKNNFFSDKKSFRKKIIFSIFGILIVGFITLVIHNYKTKTSFKYKKQTAEELKPQINPQDPVNEAINKEAELAEARKNSELLKPLSSDYILGDKNAPVVFIEYASLSCPHCASFAREAFEKLKTEYIDAGKMAFIFRNFPLNHPALAAAMLSECQAKSNSSESKEKYYSTIKILFRTQDSWAFDEKFIEKLEAIFKLDGMSSESFKTCINNKALQEKVLSNRMEASKSLALKSTPTFFINGEALDGFVDYKSLKVVIDKKLAEAQK